MLLSPTGTQYPVGTLINKIKTYRSGVLIISLKRQNFDGFLGFLTGSCEGAYLVVRN